MLQPGFVQSLLFLALFQFQKQKQPRQIFVLLNQITQNFPSKLQTNLCKKINNISLTEKVQNQDEKCLEENNNLTIETVTEKIIHKINQD